MSRKTLLVVGSGLIFGCSLIGCGKNDPPEALAAPSGNSGKQLKLAGESGQKVGGGAGARGPADGAPPATMSPNAAPPD